MSQWTHVNGAIRYDALRIPGLDTPFYSQAEVKEFLGNTASYDDPIEAWDNCNVPCGSEGSIEFVVHENPSETSLAAFGVHVFGDLRDFGSDEDVEKIREWFKRVTTTAGVMVRSAILEINVEYGDAIILRYEDKE